MLWSTISKAFSRSRKITALIFSMSILYAQESVTSSKAVTVQWIAKKPTDVCIVYRAPVNRHKSLEIFSLQYLDHNWDNRDRTVIVYFVSITFLEKGCDFGRFPVFWSLPCLIDWLKISHKGTQMRSAHSRIRLADTLSRPVAHEWKDFACIGSLRAWLVKQIYPMKR